MSLQGPKPLSKDSDEFFAQETWVLSRDKRPQAPDDQFVILDLR